MSKIAFLFAGQGAQYSGMGKDIAEKYPEAMEVFDLANELLNFDIKELCFNGSKEELNKTENTQPAIVTTTIAILKALEAEGIKAEGAAGLSLGEYSSLIYGKALRLEDGIPLVKKRGRYMQEEVPVGVGGMLAVLNLTKEQIQEQIEKVKEYGIIEVANYNCPGQIVLTGEKKPLEEIVTHIKECGGRAMPLPVSAPFHSTMLKGAGEKLFNELKHVELSELEKKVYKNLTATPYEKGENIKEALRLQLMSPVKWDDTIRNMINDGYDVFVEIGPGKTLSSFLRKIDRNVKSFNVENLDTLEKVINGLKEI